MPKVLNARQAGTKPAADRVYVGRPSRWGNRFVIGRDGTRDQVIAKSRMDRAAAGAHGGAAELRNKTWYAGDYASGEDVIEVPVVRVVQRCGSRMTELSPIDGAAVRLGFKLGRSGPPFLA